MAQKQNAPSSTTSESELFRSRCEQKLVSSLRKLNSTDHHSHPRYFHHDPLTAADNKLQATRMGQQPRRRLPRSVQPSLQRRIPILLAREPESGRPGQQAPRLQRYQTLRKPPSPSLKPLLLNTNAPQRSTGTPTANTSSPPGATTAPSTPKTSASTPNSPL